MSWAFLDRERIVTGPGFNRWLIPPAALAIHLSIGMAYGFSVFWLPLSRAVGISQPVAYPEAMGLEVRIFSTSHDWPISMLGWIYTLFFVFLGGSAAVLGRWVEKAGPRKAGLLAACCWGGGLVLASLGVYLHQILLLWFGLGVVGGIGLGLGYISPVSTLIKWFPDRRGLATGLAIMGFGGGAMIGAPLANRLTVAFASESSVGVWETFLVLAAIYFVAMTLGALGYRLPPPGWRPPALRRQDLDADRGHAGQQASTPGTVSFFRSYVPVTGVHRTPQFWLLWAVLCLNVSAGIGVIGMASPMIQEVFGGRLVGLDVPLNDLTATQAARVATIAAAFTGLLSLFNILGRIGWASFSDYAGRKATYSIFFSLGAVLYATVPWAGQTSNLALFVGVCCIILTMYGGGFAAIPAYLADLFGSQHISAIHGRLLTAWSVAGVLGPVAVNYLRDWQLARGLAASEAYNATLYLLAATLLVGLVCNLLIRPVPARHFERIEESERSSAPAVSEAENKSGTPPVSEKGYTRVILAWTAVGIPLLWGVWQTLAQALMLFD